MAKSLNEKFGPYRRTMLWIIFISVAVSVGAAVIGDHDNWTAEEQKAARAAFCQELKASFRIVDAPEDQISKLNLQLDQRRQSNRAALKNKFSLNDEQTDALIEWARLNTLGAHAQRCSEVE